MSTKIDPTDFSFLPLPPSTQHRSHTSLCPMSQQPLCAFVSAAQMLLLTLGNLPSDLKGPCLSKTDIPDLCPLSPSPPECCQHPTRFYISAASKVMSKAINLDQTEDWKASISPTFQTQSFRCRSSLAWKLARDYLYSSTYSQLFSLELNRRVNISASGPQIRQPSHQQSRDRGRHQLFILDRGVKSLNIDLFLFARAL